MADWTVRRRGTDSSGRGIYASDYMWDWWQRVTHELGFTPTITQGAWMTLNGGGAQASAGYHDGGGCFDLRVWDLNNRQADQAIRTLRRYGAAAWVRDSRHGDMDPHIHFVLGSDHDIDDGALQQWREYLAGGDGLVGGGPDYHWRPNPLVLQPPEDAMSPEDWTRMDARLDRFMQKLDAFAEASKRRDVAQRKISRLQTDLIEAHAVKDEQRAKQILREIRALEDADQ